jgi:hypothetical protein
MMRVIGVTRTQGSERTGTKDDDLLSQLSPDRKNGARSCVA